MGWIPAQCSHFLRGHPVCYHTTYNLHGGSYNIFDFYVCEGHLFCQRAEPVVHDVPGFGISLLTAHIPHDVVQNFLQDRIYLLDKLSIAFFIPCLEPDEACTSDSTKQSGRASKESSRSLVECMRRSHAHKVDGKSSPLEIRKRFKCLLSSAKARLHREDQRKHSPHRHDAH